MAGRPAKPVSQISKNLTKEERQNREAVEQITAGKRDKLKPPAHLTRDQKKIFKFILEQTEEAQIFGNLDVYALAQGAICIDRLNKLDAKINEDINVLLDAKVNTLQDKLFKQFARICNELSLSPQSRAKLAIKAADGTEKKKSILDILAEDDE